jgi:hypothetical protein
MKKIIFLVFVLISINNLLSQPFEEWELIYDGTYASEFKTNISPKQLRVFDNKHFGFIEGSRSYGGFTKSLILSDNNFKSQFKALKFKYPDSVWVIIQDWNYVNEKVIYALADSCKIRDFDGINTFYYYKAFILKSEDGGKSWSNIPINEKWRTHPSNAVSMIDSKNGVIVQFPNQEDPTEKTDLMWITNDEWITKTQIALNSKMLAITNLKYSAKSFITARNLTNDLFYSKDNGTSWEVNPIPKDLILNNINYLNFYILNENTIYFVSNNNSQIDGYNRSIIAKSSNSGKTWDKIYDNTGDSSIVNLSFFNDSSFYSHGTKIKYTTDNGKSWEDKSKDYVNNFDTPVYSFNILPDSSKIALTYLKIYSTKLKSLYVISFPINEFSISPNPANDYILINVGAIHELPLPEQIEIFNIFGEKVEQTFLSVQDGQTGMSDPLKIDISNLASGVYFIKVGDKIEKFVKL